MIYIRIILGTVFFPFFLAVTALGAVAMVMISPMLLILWLMDLTRDDKMATPALVWDLVSSPLELWWDAVK